MKRKIVSLWFVLSLPIVVSAMQVDESEVGALCSFPYSCDEETRAADTRVKPGITQPISAQPIQGSCIQIPAAQSFQAQIGALECGSTSVVQSRERIQYPQEHLDRNAENIQANQREEAQKVLKATVGYNEQLKFTVKENWTYKRKVGDFVDCRGRYGAEGGAVETYRTQCFRQTRNEKVFRKVITKKRNCARFTPKPPDPEPVSSGGSGVYIPGSTGGGGGYSPSPAPSYHYSPPSAPSGRGETYQEMERNGTGSKAWGDGGYLNIQEILNQKTILPEISRDPARSNYYGQMREMDSRVILTDGDSGTYGCDDWGNYKVVDTDKEEYTISADPLSYSCIRTRNQWCTWFVDEPATALCPEQKTATVDVKFVTPSDWNPSNPLYDDQLPNKFDLLLGEAEFLKISANDSLSSTMRPSLRIENAVKDKNGKYRELPWNKYETRISPGAVTCQYKDQKFEMEVNTLGRNVQAAPNPLQIPTDEAGNYLAFEGTDSKGRPAILNLINPARSLVLDRSNLSRIFGADPNDPTATSSVAKKDEANKGGVPKQFWENTKFWMRLYWKDKRGTQVKVTQAKQFDINKANPVGDYLAVSLDGKMGMDKFYNLALPFEDVLSFLGGDAALDPNQEYFLEIKVAQPGFNGIYTSGYRPDDKTPENERKIKDKSAYSESLVIPMKAIQSKPTLWQKFWLHRMKKFYRPKIKDQE